MVGFSMRIVLLISFTLASLQWGQMTALFKKVLEANSLVSLWRWAAHLQPAKPFCFNIL